MRRTAKFRSRILILFLISAVFSISAFSPPDFLSMLDEWSWDQLYLLRDQKKQSSSITVILITESSIKPFGFRSPVPRKLLAKVINVLHKKGAKVIGLNILLDRKHLSDHDRSLQDALSNARGKVVLAAASSAVPEAARRKAQPVLTEFASGNIQGYVIAAKDERDLAKWIGVGQSDWGYSFAEALFKAYTGDYPSLRGIVKDTDGTSWIRINFQGYPTRLETETPPFDVFEAHIIDDIPDFLIENRIVLIGGGIEESGDVFKTPFSTSSNNYLPTFGVNLSANTLEMMLNDDYLIHPPQFVLFIVFIGIFCITSLLFSILRPLAACAGLIALQLVLILLSAGMFITAGILFPMITPLIGLISIFTAYLLLESRGFRIHAKRIVSRLGIVEKELEKSHKKLNDKKKELKEKTGTINVQSIRLNHFANDIGESGRTINQQDSLLKRQDEKIEQLEQDLKANEKIKEKYYEYLKYPDKKKSVDVMVNSMESILYIEAQGKDCVMHLNNNSEPIVLFDMSLEFIDHVFARTLLRIHNSCVINKSKVTHIIKEKRHYIVYLTDGLAQNISDNYRKKPKVIMFMKAYLK